VYKNKNKNKKKQEQRNYHKQSTHIKCPIKFYTLRLHSDKLRLERHKGLSERDVTKSHIPAFLKGTLKQSNIAAYPKGTL
jgi:hypothetical protein